MKLSQLALGATSRKAFSFKRRRLDGQEVECHVLIQILTAHELDAARINAVRYVNSLDGEKTAGQTREDILKDSETIEVLSIALRDPEDPSRIWATPDELRVILTTVEIALLSKAYEDHQNEVGPILRKMDSEQFEATLELIAKLGTADPLVFFDWHTQRSFITSLACQLVTLRTANVSTTSESSEPKSDSLSDIESLSDDAYESILARLKVDLGLVKPE